MKLITENKKWKLYLVDPDEVFDILGKSDGKGLFCRVIKGKYQAATHELKYLKVSDIKNYIEYSKNNNPNDFIIFYRVVENKRDRRLRFHIHDEWVEGPEKDIIDAEKICKSGPCGSQICPLHGIGGCTVMIRMYDKGEFEEVDE